ncbi:MAG: hypothetical protein WAqPseu_19960 [Shewanella algae]|uniref:hypothetical protein n=1 Tax=Shewanella TaxID=22 RepID=UPI001CC224FF|nr:hypothetical protein [Shewanella algae]
MLTNQGSGTISRCAQNSPRLGRQLLTGIQMNFDNLKSILVLDDDHEINLINNDWLVTKGFNSDDHNWLSKEQFDAVFISTSEHSNNISVYAFETFERTYTSTGLTKRLNAEFELNWESFDRFQSSTDILFLYVVPKNLSWIFYANRDWWQFAKRN